MAKWLIIIFSLFLLETVKGQDVQNISYDTLYSLFDLKSNMVNKSLKKNSVYKVNPCIYTILKGIVKNDVKCEYFIKDKTAYAFSVNKVHVLLLFILLK